MVMRVMGIGHMGMSMLARAVLVMVAVFAQQQAVVRFIMLTVVMTIMVTIVVPMCVLVFLRRVAVRVFVRFRQVQQHACQHQRAAQSQHAAG